MANWVSEQLSQGQNDAVDRTDLSPGELQQSVGAWYKPGDPTRVHKQGGRSAFGDTGSSAKVKGVYLAGFDAADDLLLAYSGTTIYKATAGATGTFASLITGLNSSATRLCGAHYNDRHYICNGYDKNYVVESDGSTRYMGMEAPKQAPPVTVSDAAGTATRPATPGTGDLSDGANTRDADLDTYGYLSLATADTATVTWSAGEWTGAAYGAAQILNIKWALAGIPLYGDAPLDTYWIDDTGGTIDTGYNVTLKLELSVNAGSSYTTIMERTASSVVNATNLQYPVASGTDPDNVRVKATLTYNSGTKDAVWRIYDVRIQDGSPTTAFSTTTGVYYGISEFDEDTGEESPVVATKLITLSSQNQAALTLPSSAQNTNATHWNIYRTHDGGTVPQDLGLIDQIDIGQTAYYDDFQLYDKDTPGAPLVAMLNVEAGSGTLRFPRDTPPPSLRRIRSFGGFLVGLTRTNTRELRYCVPGLPASWPEFYVITAFPLEEHDELVDCVDLGGQLLIAAKGAMLRTETLPRVVQGTFDASEIIKIPGAPGCASEYGLTALSVAGESHAAWITNDAHVYITNGATYECITRDISGTLDDMQDYDKSGWVLRWDRRRQVLVYAYSATSGGENDRYIFIHMAPEHRKANGMPKITIGHYGEYADLVCAQTGDTYRVYSAHPDDGYVYLEDSGTTDAALSYDTAGTCPFILKTRRIYGGDTEFSALRAKLRHSDWGDDETITVAWASGRDTTNTSQTRSQSVSLDGQSATLFDIARGGEWHEITLTHTGSAVGSIQDLQFEARALGSYGKVSID